MGDDYIEKYSHFRSSRGGGYNDRVSHAHFRHGGFRNRSTVKRTGGFRDRKDMFVHKPRYTGSGRLNLNVNGPSSRMGWILAIVVGIILIVWVFPWVVSQTATNTLGGIWDAFRISGSQIAEAFANAIGDAAERVNQIIAMLTGG